ncbi:MAG: DUF5686 and carboxypeptidase regulatory-like domain-containing protein [Muribaculaceae bacterium]|nr:DUF5686 and carboxypeptidase regulatory-like domain-containing protein [Muribaculaceae bacterium]
MRVLRPLILFILLPMAVLCRAESVGTVIRGIVRDSVSTEGLPYASVRIDGHSEGVVADGRGIFELTVPDGATALIASCQGYQTTKVPLHKRSIQLYDINLSPQATELQEVVVKKSKYSKRNNPAVDFARRLRNLGPETDPRRNDRYSYRTYERVAMGINNFDTTRANSMMRSIPSLIEHIDTSEISGANVLNISVKERAADVHYRREPRAERTIITGTRSEGIDDIIDQENAFTMLAEMLRPVDLYEGDINLLKNNFVSPLSGVAPDFYRFYLVDSTAVIPGSDKPHIVLAFYPRNKSGFGFRGHIYVAADDTTMSVARAEMSVSNEINLNFVKNLRLVQNFTKADDGSRLPLDDILLLELDVMPGAPELYLTRKINYHDHTFNPPAETDTVFSTIGDLHTAADADGRDDAFWAEARRIPMPRGESNADLLLGRLRKRKLFYYGEKFLRWMVLGYIPTGSDSRFDFGPLNTIASYNSLEGLRLRAGGMTTAQLNPHIFGRGYVAYGFRDHRWKYNVEGEYSFNEKKNHPREFPIHSIRLSHGYDIDRLGSHYLYTNSDNFVLSLARMSDDRFTYRRHTKLTYTLELENHLSITAAAEHIRQCEGPAVPFIDGAGRHISHFSMPVMEVGLRYAPGETFYQSRSYRVPIDETVPIFELVHRWGPSKALGSDFGVNRTEFSFTKLFRLSFMGALDMKLSAGHVWDKTVFTELFIPNANLSYTIQPGSFALMNPMEFINSSYVSWHLTYEARGALFNLIPGLRRLKLREVVSFAGIYGKLAAKSTPGTDNPDLLMFPTDAAMISMNRPYMEISAGLDNIFRILRVDYVWRLNYLDVPYTIDRRGIRVALHFTF